MYKYQSGVASQSKLHGMNYFFYEIVNNGQKENCHNVFLFMETCGLVIGQLGTVRANTIGVKNKKGEPI